MEEMLDADAGLPFNKGKLRNMHQTEHSMDGKWETS